jgi:hypothetical protein
MGGGRAGWYNWGAIDNGGAPRAPGIVREYQSVARGDIMPAVPDAQDAFVVATVDPPRDLVLTVPDGRGGHAVGWELVLEALPGGRTRLIVRGRASSQCLARAARGPARRSRVCGDAWCKALLAGGVASSLLYASMMWGIRYEGYSPVSQVPSELSAVGAPTQALWARLGWIYTVLITAFGIGVWKSAGRNRAVRIVGGFILGYASLGLLWPFAPMHQRDVLAAGGGTLGDTLHLVLGGVTVVLMFLAIGFGATAFGTRFRVYSIVTIVLFLVFGGLTFVEAPRLQMNLPTPWIGLWERINISVFLLWIVMLAAALWATPGKNVQGEAS